MAQLQPLCYSPGVHGGAGHLEKDHESTCQPVVLVSLHELNMVDLYWDTVLFATRHYRVTIDARSSNYHCDCAQTLRPNSPVCPQQEGRAEAGDGRSYLVTDLWVGRVTPDSRGRPLRRGLKEEHASGR